ncbi:hypothetical protein E8E12_005681 [Didymella heteroderae]|uniref:Uncharacterized protein n=1 Tax=Didymella heteroderae TaxID=1769908 RepID=A0A9P4WUI8_9PLEO|nr:hypothetical protein E8E12_005681 [Didymella heteroderae]
MADNADTSKQALLCLNKQHDCIIIQVRDQGLTETILTSISENITRHSVAPARVNTQSQAGSASSSATGAVPARSVEHSDGLTRRIGTFAISRHKTHPKVITPCTNHKDGSRRRIRALPRTISHLRSRAATESWEDGELEAQSINTEPAAEETSEDELAYDTPRPAKPSKLVRLPKSGGQAKSKRPTKSPKRVPKLTRAPAAQFEKIDWIFWIQADDVGYWRPFSDFPRTAQRLFELKFSSDYLQRQYHIHHYARMLRNRDKRVAKYMCVNNVTHENRNKPSRWRKTGDQDSTCDLCFHMRRFCARLVKVDRTVKLGFFPLPECDRDGVTWKEIQFWIRGEEKKGDEQDACEK